MRTSRLLRDGGWPALSALFGGAPSTLSAAAPSAQSGRAAPVTGTAAQPAGDLKGLISEAARDLSDYQRLTSEGKLGEAGQKLEHLKRVLDQLNARQK